MNTAYINTSPDFNELSWADTTNANAEFERIMNNREITIAFQPVFDTAIPRIIGYEALARGPANCSLHNPLDLFAVASSNIKLGDFERICWEIACDNFVSLRLAGKLFLNITPMSFISNYGHDAQMDRIMGNRLPTERIVLELSEHYPLHEYDLIKRASLNYQGQGFEIAIDDLGAGYAGLRAWSEIEPDYVKVDRHFIENIHTDSVKREFVRSIQQISRSLGCKVIAEGVETAEELAAVRSTGIMLMQGYYLGMPNTTPDIKIPSSLNGKYLSLNNYRTCRQPIYIGDMVEKVTAIPPYTSLGHVADLFQKNLNLASIPVVKDDAPVGIIVRRHILELFLSRFGRELYARKPIKYFMNEKPIIVEHDFALEKVSRIITDDPYLDMSLDFIIVKVGKYMGVGKTWKLLKEITEQQIRSARYSNPLTLLPGNVPICEWSDELLKTRSDFHIAYFDLNNFKPYNDIYGYSRGDEVIVKLGEILSKHANGDDDLVGHIGGDDFVVIFRSQDWEARCQEIIKDFEKIIDQFYPVEALTSGKIWGVNRSGKRQYFDLLGLAIGVAWPDCEQCHTHHDVAALVADAKHQAKLLGGNIMFVSRRRGPETNTSQHVNANENLASVIMSVSHRIF